VDTFEISADYIPLNKLLKASGLCQSGGTAKLAIESGAVRVDGEVEHRKRRKIRNGQKVEFGAHAIEVIQARR
jgi:ribosome-associated protein